MAMPSVAYVRSLYPREKMSDAFLIRSVKE